MKLRKIIFAFVLLIGLIHPPAVLAFETDQYNLPPVPLADIGDEVTEYVAGQLHLAAANVNARIAASESCLDAKIKGCDSPEKERKELEYLRSEQAIANEVYERLSGGNLMTTKFGKWMDDHKFRVSPASYKAPFIESIYILKPTNYVTLSPTIRMYGHEFGVDKLEHLFQQGHQYYEKVNKDIKDGHRVGQTHRADLLRHSHLGCLFQRRSFRELCRPGILRGPHAAAKDWRHDAAGNPKAPRRPLASRQ
jgi:hypothetical protein